MDNMEFYRQKFIEELMKLKEKYDLPDIETDKVILDFDNIGQYIDDKEALKSYSGQLLDMTEYRANAGVSPNPYEDLNLTTPNDNDLLYVSERKDELIKIINNIENDVIKEGLLKRYEDLDNYIFDDMNEVRKKELLRFTNNQVIEDINSFKEDLNTPYRELQWPATENINTHFFDWKEPTPVEDAYWAEVEGWEKDADGNPIDPSKNSESFSNFQKKLDNEYNSLETGQGDEFNKIINNEQSTHWWRYDNSYSDEAKDYMERYTTGDLTDEEMQELIDDQNKQNNIDNKIADAKARYDAEVAETAGQLGITDTKAFKTLVQVGAKLLNAIDEELIYSPLLLAEKGLKALGLTVPGKAIGGLGRAAMAYEGYLFQAQLGLAALSQGATAIAGGASRLPGEIANGILNLYGAGMPEGVAPDVETGISKEEQAKRQEMMFYNQMYQYSRLSPSLRLFTDVIGPKTGMYDVIQGYKTGFDRFSKMLGGDK